MGEPGREGHLEFSSTKRANIRCRKNKKYIIGGVAGGGALVLILLVLLLVYRCRRRSKRDPERSGGDRSQEQPMGCQFARCNHGTGTRDNGQLRMEQRTPLRPFVLKSDPDALTSQKAQQHIISLNRRNSTESQGSAGADEGTRTPNSSDSEGSPERKFHKRPPPLKLASLVTPVINGPQDNPRRRVDRSLRSEPT